MMSNITIAIKIYLARLIIQQIVKEYKAEEMRILYVAMTRARETHTHCTVRNTGKICSICLFSIANNDKNSHLIISSCRQNQYSDWLAPTIARL